MMTVSLTRYHVIFGVTFLVITVAIALLRLVIDSGGLSGVSLITPFLVSTFVADRFLKKERRVPNPAEKRKLVWGGLIMFVMLNCIFVGLAMASGVFQTPELQDYISYIIIAVVAVLLIGVLINYFLMKWAYGGLLEKRAEKLGIGTDTSDTFR